MYAIKIHQFLLYHIIVPFKNVLHGMQIRTRVITFNFTPQYLI